ncbi:MAG: DegV family protein [Oscillospiraceae bacterium]|nr:DegV family protein [Oscillospiraceae bacterium]
MAKVIITSDSTADLNHLAAENNVRIVPLYINLGDRSLADDGKEIVPDDIYAYVAESGNLPTSSANPVGVYEDLFKELTSEGYDVVHLNLGSKFSSTHQNARIAAEEYSNVFVVDTANLSTGSGLLVLEAARMAKEGMAAESIAKELEALALKVDASFVIDDLTYLHKGGRCSSVAKLGANLLKLKPCIQVKDGAMGVAKKYRGEYKKCVAEYIKDKLADTESIDPRRVFVTHTKCDDDIVKLAIDTVNDCFKFDELVETTAGCTITTHCGPNTLGVLFFRKNDLE